MNDLSPLSIHSVTTFPSPLAPTFDDIAMLCQSMSSSPYSFGRPSSPLNPHSDRSSSPPSSSSSSSTASFRQRTVHNPSSPSPTMGHKTRYQRPNQKKYLASAPSELFAEGTTPTEGLMWREKFSKRVEDRERRRQNREGAIDRRRGGLDVFEEEDEEKARADDEEVSAVSAPASAPFCLS